ncbi:hypothetical protein ACFX12_033432 [Malus domestica]
MASSSRSRSSKGKGVAAETSTPSPFKIKLEVDHLHTGVLKIDPSKEFEEHIVGNMTAANQKLLHEWKPVEFTFKDVDTDQTYTITLQKTASYKFLSDQSKEQEAIDMRKAKDDFFYTIRPSSRAMDKRQLMTFGDQGIGMPWTAPSVDSNKPALEVSVLYVPRLDLPNHQETKWLIFQGRRV